MDDIVEAAPPARPTRTLYAAGLVGVGLVAGLVLAGLNVATAETPSPSPSTGTSQAPLREKAFRGPGRGDHGPGMRGALHGEFTTRAPSGGYQVMATQNGTVTSVSATALTVKSEDGYSRTYTVGDDTLVNAGNDGIGDVKTGDTVHVLAVVKDGTANAVQVMDGTNIKNLRGKWLPRGPQPGTESSST